MYHLILDLAMFAVIFKAFTLGSEFNFYQWHKHGKEYLYWYNNRPKFSKHNNFNNNCDKVIKELQCNLTAEEIYETLVNKEVVLEIHNGVVEVHKKSKGVKIYIKDYDIENEVHDKNYVESNYDADIEI